MADRNTYTQALTHMIKGNLGAGLLAMPASFAHAGLYGGIIGLPMLCLISGYCVQLLLRSSRHLSIKNKSISLEYGDVSVNAFRAGPRCTQRIAEYMSRIVEVILFVTQLGVCCVYLIFIVDNITEILGTYKIIVSKSLVFACILPFMVLLGLIRTLNRLSYASLVANLSQTLGLLLIVEYLFRDLDKFDLTRREKFMPIKDIALGFGSAMFAFEGISVVLPIYRTLRKPEQMPGVFGVANVSFVIILILYFIVGILGYLRFGHRVRDSITLNLPATPLYDAVRAMFTLSILLSYPLQFYVLNQIVWTWVKNNLLESQVLESNLRQVMPTVDTFGPSLKPKLQPQQQQQEKVSNKVEATSVAISGVSHTSSSSSTSPTQSSTESLDPSSLVAPRHLLRHEYCCRVALVLITFTLACSVPKLNLLMDLVGSMTGTLLSLTLPATIHLTTFIRETHGSKKVMLVLIDSAIIIFSLVAGGTGSVISFTTILNSIRK